MSKTNSFEEEVYIDPLIVQAFNSWREQLKFFNFWLGVLVIFIYFVTKKVLVPSYYFPWAASFWLVFFLVFKVDLFWKQTFQSLIIQSSHSLSKIKRYLALWSLWILSLVMGSKVGWFSRNFDPGTVVFLSYLPAVWLFKIPRTINGLLALSVLVLVPLLLIGSYEKTAEIFAVIVYFLLVTATVEGFIELRQANDKKD